MQLLSKDVTGIVPIFKPIGPTSHDVIYRIRKHTGVKKVGHAGTLDPLASGVLVVGITKEGTKALTGLIKKEKEYIAEVRLGQTSETDDMEGKKTGITETEPENLERMIKENVSQFIGEIWQIPPVFSAAKVGGKKSYVSARDGEIIELPPRKREVKSIEILEYEWPILKLKIVTGSGVYIRSIARDLGTALNVGGHLQNLERTRVDSYTIADCYQI